MGEGSVTSGDTLLYRSALSQPFGDSSHLQLRWHGVPDSGGLVQHLLLKHVHALGAARPKPQWRGQHTEAGRQCSLLASPHHPPTCSVPRHFQTMPGVFRLSLHTSVWWFLLTCTWWDLCVVVSLPHWQPSSLCGRSDIWEALLSLCPGFDARTSAFVLCLLFKYFGFIYFLFLSIHMIQKST